MLKQLQHIDGNLWNWVLNKLQQTDEHLHLVLKHLQLIGTHLKYCAQLVLYYNNK
jgi:hypothetical protein